MCVTWLLFRSTGLFFLSHHQINGAILIIYSKMHATFNIFSPLHQCSIFYESLFPLFTNPNNKVYVYFEARMYTISGSQTTLYIKMRLLLTVHLITILALAKFSS